MAVLLVPPPDPEPWPTLGPQLCDWIETFLVYGPGDLRGQPYVVDPEFRGLIYRAYEIRPADRPAAGRRRFRRVGWSMRKGLAKPLALETPIPTVDGWKPQGDLRAGDVVFDEQGRPCSVTAVHEPVLEDCWRLTFSDGTSIVAGGSHAWPLIEFTGGRVHRDPTAIRLGRQPAYWRVDVATRDIAAAGLTYPRRLTAGSTKASRPGVARYRSLPTPEIQTPVRTRPPGRAAYSNVRTLVSIEPVPTVPTRCVTVDSPSHLYLAGEGMVPTHNTEKAAILTICEAHPDAPVRFDGWDAGGDPVGRGIEDPYIPMIAYTVDQSEELAYGAVRAILEESELGEDFDIGLERTLVLDEHGRARGKIVPLAGSPNARDGARTTFAVVDESHRLSSPRLVSAHRTMLANLPKRPMSEPWQLEITTAFEPGAGSVAEAAHNLAQAINDGRATDPTFGYFARWAGDTHDTSTPDGLRAAVIEASGPHASWSDIDGIVAQWADPEADHTYLERVWLNRATGNARRAFTEAQLDLAEREGDQLLPGDLVALGFDGSKSDDSTGLVATRIHDGLTALLAGWERPTGPDGDGWEVPRDEPELVIADAMSKLRVWRLYGDPRFWETDLARWAGRWPGKIVSWATNQYQRMAPATRVWHQAVLSGEWGHDGGPDLRRHLRNMCRRDTRVRDVDTGEVLWVPGKETQRSPLKIDYGVAAVLAWQARIDAQAAGADREPEPARHYRAAGF